MQAHRSSGDLLADKRFAYAEALAADDDYAAAADLYEQAASLAPDWAPAYLSLGLALEKLGDRARAEQALVRAEQLDADGGLGAGLHRARVAGHAVQVLPAPYVAALFDQYAPRFDAHLTGELGYRGPAIILECLAGFGRPVSDGAALDLGCGTGLMARALGPRVAPLDGVDISAAMIAHARATGLYRRLLVGDCVAATGALAAHAYALVFAADVLVYLGDLAPVAHAVAHLLAPGGLFVATVQAGEGDDYRLGTDLRFRHSAGHLRAAFGAAGLAIVALGSCTTRREAGQDVPGLVFAASAS